MSNPPGQSDFQLSRVYAQGWNAGRRLQLEGDPDDSKLLNPYPNGPERVRWNEGFFGALS